MSWLWRQSQVTTRAGTHHWQGKTVSPCDVKTPRYDGVKIYSRLGQDTSIRYELALTPGPGHITGRRRLQVRATSRPQDVVLGKFKIYSRLGLSTPICIRNELALGPGCNKSLAGEDRKSMRRQDSEIRWCQDLFKAGPGYLHSKRAGTDTGTRTHHWQGKTVSPCDVKTPRYGGVKIYSRLGLGTSETNWPQDRYATNHWQGKAVSPCDVKTPRYGGVKIYSRLGQDTSIRDELALTLGPGHITGRGRP